MKAKRSERLEYKIRENSGDIHAFVHRVRGQIDLDCVLDEFYPRTVTQHTNTSASSK